MNEALRRYLESKGLKKGATDAEAWAHYHKLAAADRTQADALKTGEAPAAPAPGSTATLTAAEPTPAPAPAAAPAPAPAAATPTTIPSLSQSDVDARVQTALRADRQRRTTLASIAGSVGLGDRWVDQQFDAGTTPDRAREMALEHLQTGQAPVRGISGHVSVTGDNNVDSLAQAVEDSLFIRLNQPIPQTDELGNVLVDTATGRARTRPPHERARQFRGLSIPEIIRGQLHALGVAVTGMDRVSLCKLAMNRLALSRHLGGVMLTHSTSDFPSLLENVGRRIIRRAYVEAPSQWPRFARRVTHPDFKTISSAQLAEFPNLRKVHEGGEIKRVTLGETGAEYALAVYAEIFEITWQALVNDDMNMFARLPQSMGQAARRKEDILVFGVLINNPLMSDGNALFSVAHGNLAQGADVDPPSVATLNAAASAMGTQEGLTSDPTDPIILDLEPNVIVAPRALQGTVLELLGSQVNPDSTNNTANIWEDRLEPVFSGRLDVNSTTAWYLAADPNRQPVDTIELAFLEGNEQPMVDQEDGFDVLARKYRVVHAIEAAPVDWRGLYMNAGT